MKPLLKIVLIIVGIGILLLVAIQIIPYGRNHSNPPPSNPVVWDSAQTEAIARRACYDCHSNETVWPWYANVAPASWLVQFDVDRGRRSLNFSDRSGVFSGELIEIIQEGEMPPIQYILLHPTARLNQAEKTTLIQGIQNSIH
jgi:hypothetical protein